MAYEEKNGTVTIWCLHFITCSLMFYRDRSNVVHSDKKQQCLKFVPKFKTVLLHCVMSQTVFGKEKTQNVLCFKVLI